MLRNYISQPAMRQHTPCAMARIARSFTDT
jgi:hypothetical protein